MLRLLLQEIRRHDFSYFIDQPPSVAQGGRGGRTYKENSEGNPVDYNAWMISSFSARCPICKETVHSAVLGHGSTENLQKGEGDVELAHPTNDPRVGDNKWKLTDPQAKANLLKLINKENWDGVPGLPPYGRGQRP